MDHEALVDGEPAHRKLYYGAAAGDIPLMRRALAAGADPNLIDYANSVFSPLQVAAICCKPEAVATLLSVGARVDLATDNGTTPFMMALELVHVNERDKRAIIHDLISAGADVHARGQRGGAYRFRTPFRRALELGFRWILLDLLRAGAEVNTVIHSEVITATDKKPSFENTVEVSRWAKNASAWALVDAIRKAGDFDEYARRQLNIQISMLTKCFATALPVDAWSHVAGFYAPRGGY